MKFFIFLNIVIIATCSNVLLAQSKSKQNNNLMPYRKKEIKIPKRNQFDMQPGEVRHFPLDFVYNPNDVKIDIRPANAIEISHRPKDGIITLKALAQGNAKIQVPTPSGKPEYTVIMAEVNKEGFNSKLQAKQDINQKLQKGNSNAKLEALDTFINSADIKAQQLSPKSIAELEKMLNEQMQQGTQDQAKINQSLKGMEQLFDRSDGQSKSAFGQPVAENDETTKNEEKKSTAAEKSVVSEQTKEQLMKIVANKGYDVDTRLKAMKILTQHAKMAPKDFNQMSDQLKDIGDKATGEEIKRFVEQSAKIPTEATQAALQSLVAGGKCSGTILCNIFSIMQKANNPALQLAADDILRNKFEFDRSDETKACALIYLATTNKEMAIMAIEDLIKASHSPKLAKAILRAGDIILRGPKGQAPDLNWQKRLALNAAWFQVQLSSLNKEDRAAPLGFVSMISDEQLLKLLVEHMYVPHLDVREQVALAASRIERPASLEILFSLHRFETEESAKDLVEACLQKLMDKCSSCRSTVIKIYSKKDDAQVRDLAQRATEKKLADWPHDKSPWPPYSSEIN